MDQNLKSIDIGCGPNKKPGCYGVDCAPFACVDQVFDLGQEPWPLPTDHFQSVHCSHVIEHLLDAKVLLRQIHRICVDGALVYFETPHFSCIESWSDPTHVLHLSSRWHGPLTNGGYLGQVVGRYEHVRTELEFATGLRGRLARLVVSIVGRAAYERYYAFAFPALNVKTWMKVCKEPQP